MKEYVANVSVADFAAALDLQILVEGRGAVPLASMNISRPGLQLAGYFEHFDRNRVQVMGMAEHEFLAGFDEESMGKVLEELFKRDVPCLIMARNLFVPDIMARTAEKYGCPLFVSGQITTQVVNDLYSYLSKLLAQETMRHGVLVDVAGVGMLIEGDAGIGKSELALELISRGHRLVADDCVIIRLVNDNLVGAAPEKIRNYMEIRGLGIINIQTMYGPGSVRTEKTIDIVVRLERWDENKEYDRIGDIKLTESILGIEKFKLLIPVSPGRNIPVIIETAARKYRLKQLGYDAAQELLEKTLK